LFGLWDFLCRDLLKNLAEGVGRLGIDRHRVVPRELDASLCDLKVVDRSVPIYSVSGNVHVSSEKILTHKQSVILIQFLTIGQSHCDCSVSDLLCD